MKINQYIDHTNLKQNASTEQIEELCFEAIEYKFKSVCINPCRVAQAYEILKDTDVLVCTVIGFPLGATTTNVKCVEAIEAVDNGAKEVDMVINVGAIKDGGWDHVRKEIEGVVDAIKGKATVKVILETCLLTDDEKVKASLICKEAGAHFVKTSTGFGTGGATIDDIKLMRGAVGSDMGVKAAGGINNYATAIAMIEAGATRIGTSTGVSIVRGENTNG